MANEALVLGGEFPTPSTDDWMALVAKVLADRPFDDVLVSHTYDGLAIQPLYTARDLDVSVDPAGLPGSGSQTRGGRPEGHVEAGWDIRQRISASTAVGAAAAALDELGRGSTSLLFDLAPALAGDVATVLADVHLDLAAVCFAPGDTRAFAEALLALWEQRALPSSARLASLGLDPLGAAARSGTEPAFLEDLADLVGPVVGLDGVRAVTVDASPYADAGASEAVELACSMATAVAYLRALTDGGMSIDAAAAQLDFTYTATADQFLTIAKLRAARRLWARVVESSGGGDRTQHQHAVTAASMMTRRDPWVNMLRTTIACFAAGVGGADAVTVAPFDAAIGISDEFARRVARNTQLLLIEESNLARVIDPAGGSWYVEDLTERLALEAWSRFQDIETNGGMAASLADGSLAATIEGQWSERLVRLAHRRDPLTGVTEFPNLAEATVDRPPLPTPPATGLPLRRHAAPFEALRDVADAAPQRPTVFLANLGPIATHTGRAGFATNLFEVGGIEALGNDGFDDADSVAAAFAESGSRLAVICSSDRRYETDAEPVARALVAAGAGRVYLAGDPGERRDAYLASGVAAFIHVGCDILEVLIGAHQVCGLPTAEVLR